jgi:hypothetical protein
MGSTAIPMPAKHTGINKSAKIEITYHSPKGVMRFATNNEKDKVTSSSLVS